MRRWPTLAVLLLAAPFAHASPLACGTYRDADSGTRLEVIDGERARFLSDRAPVFAPVSLMLRRNGDTLRFYNIDAGYVDYYTVSADGRTVTGDDVAFRKTFVLERAAACASAPPSAPGTCAADIDACIATADLAEDAMLQRYCDEGMPFACVKAIDRAKHPEAHRDQGAPPECREGTPTFSADACEAAFAKALRAAMAGFETMYADDVPLPDAQLAGLPALCARHGSARICAKVAEELWVGGRYTKSRDALRIGCERGGDPMACERFAPLSTLGDAQLKPLPAKALPCGRYVADSSALMSELDFGDRGIVTGFSGDLRARLEDGRVRIRHDKGGDFVLQRIADDRLLGIDDWNRYAVYRRDGGAASCAAPVVFEEKPLVEDCPQPGRETAAACCERGSLHGCNIVGHQLALRGAWAEAKPYYLKVCAAGVRIGCENLTQVFARGGDETVLDALDTLCAKDSHHIACDVRETTHWAALALLQAADELLRDVEDGNEAEAVPDVSPPR